MSVTNQVAELVLTKVYDRCGNSADIDMIFLEQMENILHNIMDSSGYTADTILKIANDLGDCPEFKQRCVNIRRAAFRVIT